MTTNGSPQRTPVRRRAIVPAMTDFDDLFHMLDARWPFASRVRVPEPVTPAIDVFERDGNVVVKAEMPGIAPEKIEVSVSGNELRISGERRDEKEVKDEHYFRAERTYGTIFRSVTLPEGCDTGNISASAKDGVIEIVIPRIAAATTKKVEVKSG